MLSLFGAVVFVYIFVRLVTANTIDEEDICPYDRCQMHHAKPETKEKNSPAARNTAG
jgi:hypothetical protein